MKRLMMATALMLAVTTTATWAQAPAANDQDHPPQATTPAPAQAQPSLPPAQPGPQSMMGGMPMMNMMGMMQTMGMMGSGMAGMATIGRVEGRIAFLRAELKITEGQASAWNAFADALRANAQKLGDIRASMMPKPGTAPQQVPTMADRLDQQEHWLLARLEGTRTMKSAFTKLYDALSDDQKKTANELLAPHMGMGTMAMMPMMPAQMQPGQMGPGRMQPGQMQRPPAGNR
jgi:hypothetical protein